MNTDTDGENPVVVFSIYKNEGSHRRQEGFLLRSAGLQPAYAVMLPQSRLQAGAPMWLRVALGFFGVHLWFFPEFQ